MQLVADAEMQKALDMIEPSRINSVIKLGSLVKTTAANYFLSVSIGSLSVDGTSYFAISPATPIGKLILDLHKGDSFTFNGNFISIIDHV